MMHMGWKQGHHNWRSKRSNVRGHTHRCSLHSNDLGGHVQWQRVVTKSLQQLFHRNAAQFSVVNMEVAILNLYEVIQRDAVLDAVCKRQRSWWHPCPTRLCHTDITCFCCVCCIDIILECQDEIGFQKIWELPLLLPGSLIL